MSNTLKVLTRCERYHHPGSLLNAAALVLAQSWQAREMLSPIAPANWSSNVLKRRPSRTPANWPPACSSSIQALVPVAIATFRASFDVNRPRIARFRGGDRLHLQLCRVWVIERLTGCVRWIQLSSGLYATPSGRKVNKYLGKDTGALERILHTYSL